MCIACICVFLCVCICVLCVCVYVYCVCVCVCVCICVCVCVTHMQLQCPLLLFMLNTNGGTIVPYSSGESLLASSPCSTSIQQCSASSITYMRDSMSEGQYE